MKLLNSIHNWDVHIFMHILHATPQRALRQLSRYLSASGDGLLYGLLVLVVVWQQGLEHPFVQTVAVAFSIERCAYYVLKNTLRRNRPQAAIANFTSYIVPQDQFSFPSGHTSAAFLMATLCAAFWPALTVLVFAWAAAIGGSRVLLGVHFPTDILMGALMGSGIAYGSLTLGTL